MFGDNPERQGIGPSDESNREVAVRIALDAFLMLIGYGILKMAADPSFVGGAGLLLIFVAFIHGAEWLAEGIIRAILWKETRGYANE